MISALTASLFTMLVIVYLIAWRNGWLRDALIGTANSAAAMVVIVVVGSFWLWMFS